MGSRDQMRNLEIFRVGADDAVNEFEYQKNQGELTEQQEHHLEQKDSPAPPETEAERIEQVIADAHAKVEKRRRKAKGATGTKKSAAKKSSGKKAAKKAAAKKATNKSAVKSAAKKSASRSTAKRSTKKSASKKSAGKKSAARKTTPKKSAARKPPARKTGGRRR